MKLYVCDIAYAKAHEKDLRNLRMRGNMIAVYADYNRQALMRMYRTLANFYIGDHGEFAFSGCYILFHERSENTEEVISILNKNNVRYRFAYPYTNACGGQDVKYESDASLSNDLYTYTLAFDSEEQKQKMSELLKPYCEVKTDGETAYLNFHEANWQKALNAIVLHEKIDEADIVYMTEV